MTCDVGLTLTRPVGSAVRLRGDLVLIEAKSEGGEGRCVDLMRAAGYEEVSLSKYRTGIALLAEGAGRAGDAVGCFEGAGREDSP